MNNGCSTNRTNPSKNERVATSPDFIQLDMKGGGLSRIKSVEFRIESVVDLPIFPLTYPDLLNFFPNVGQTANLFVSLFDRLFNYQQYAAGPSTIVEARGKVRNGISFHSRVSTATGNKIRATGCTCTLCTRAQIVLKSRIIIIRCSALSMLA